MYTNTPSTYNNIFNTPRSMTNILLLIINCQKKDKTNYAVIYHIIT